MKKKSIFLLMASLSLFTLSGCNEDEKTNSNIVETKKEGENEVSKYTVTWKNYDGSVLETDTNVIKGEMPSYNGITPIRESSNGIKYTFKGWDKEISIVNADITYTATYNEEEIFYTVRWLDDLGVELEVDTNLKYGVTPEFNKEDPTKDRTQEFTYEFDGWDKEITSVTEDVTYTAKFKSTKNKYTVTWLNENGEELEIDTDVEYGSTPEFNKANPIKEGNAEYRYEFDNWDKEITTVTGDITYTAKYKAFKNTYTVKWLDYDLTELEVDTNVEYGTLAEFNKEDPVRESTSEITYTFNGWDKEITTVTGDVTYTAKYLNSKNSYTIRWLDEDLTELEVDKDVEYGQMPSFDSNNPTKEGNAEYTYVFDNWDKEIKAVSGDITYIAKYKAIKNKYTVTWLDEDLTELEVDTDVEYGTLPSFDKENPVKAGNAEFSYVFDNWDKVISTVTGDITYTATYNTIKNKYTVTWLDDDLTELEVDLNVEYGLMPEYNKEEPNKESDEEFTYKFIGWDKEISTVTGDITYIAVYDEIVNTYTITWLNADGSIIEIDYDVEYGLLPSYDSPTPTLAKTAEYTYEFYAWDKPITYVYSDKTYTATYTETKNKYTVKWLDEDLTELEVDLNVEYGLTPVFNGDIPTKQSTAEYTYTFDGWDKVVSIVTGDVTYIATYKAIKNTYTVTWLNQNGMELEVDLNVEYGSTPSYNGDEPTLEKTAEFTYTFDGWDKEISTITGDVTYTAIYKATKNKYTVTWLNYDNKVLETDLNVEYGLTPSYNGETPERANTAEYTYTFDGWDKEVSTVTGDVTYIAIFKAIKNKYTVRWLNYDNSEIKVDLEIEYGTLLEYDGELPSRLKDEYYMYKFTGWTPSVHQITGDTTYIACFSQQVLPYQVYIDLNGGDSLSGVQNHSFKTDIITADMFPYDVYRRGCEFKGWSYNNVLIFDAEGNKVNDFEYASYMNFIATFEEKIELSLFYTLYNPETGSLVTRYNELPEEFGSITGAGFYHFNQEVDIVSNLASGYKLIGLFETNNYLSDSTNYKYQMTNIDASVEVRIKYDTLELTIKTNNPEISGVKISGNGSYLYNETSDNKYYTESVTVISSLRDGESGNFLGWYDESNNLLSSTPEYTFNMVNRDYKVEAKWDLFKITYDLGDSLNNPLNPDVYYSDSGIIELKDPILAPGYVFKGWLYNGEYIEKIDSSNLCHMTLKADFDILEELKPFTFEADATTGELIITGIKDKTVETIVVPNVVTEIAANAFSGCSELIDLTIPFIGDKRHSITDSYQYPLGYIFSTTSFTNSTLTKQRYIASSDETDIVYYIPSSLRNITLTEGTFIPVGAFYNCSNIRSVTYPYTVTEIGSGAFAYCNNITKAYIPDSSTTLHAHQFEWMSGITTISIPKTITLIEANAITNCKNLATINYAGTKAEFKAIVGEVSWISKCSKVTYVTCSDGKYYF
ncbi:MAG: leucine-rich repeat domain-containing protein [Bacilli bacterium]|nr:leucine-rich repeat domain-containing protein [Bacilli bacterium]